MASPSLAASKVEDDSDTCINNGNGNGNSVSYKQEKNGLVDITSLVHSCAASLSFTHPMLCTESFSLQDSMAAMELLDRKMDSCEVPAFQIGTTSESQTPPSYEPVTSGPTKTNNNCNDNSSPKIIYPRPAPMQLDDDFLPLPWDDLTVRDSVLIAVEALVRLESMLGGASVVESIYTCLYAHSAVLEDMKERLDPPTVTLTEKFENLLKSTTSSSNKQQVQQQQQPARGTLAQHVVFSTSLALVEITEIMRSIVLHGDIYEEEDFCANTYCVPIYSNKESGSTMSELMYTSRLAEEMQLQKKDAKEGQAVLHILGFLTDLLTVSSNVARVAGSRVVEVMREIKEMIGSALKHLAELRALYTNLKYKQTPGDIQLLQRTFDPFVNRPLFGNSPVRKVVFLEAAESLEVLSKIVAEIDWALCDLILKGTTLGRIRRFLDRISRSSINILTRSLIVLNLYFDEKLLGQFSLLDLIIKHMQELAAVPSDIFESKHGQIFLNRLAKPVYDTLKLRLLNRNRQRAYMEAVIIQDWSQLQQEAHIVDVHYRKEKGLDNKWPPFISHYVLANLVDLMDLHISIGVELSLFQSEEELAVVFWYRDFLLSALLNNMSAMQKTKATEHQNDSGKTGKRNKKNTSKKEKNGDDQHQLDYEYDLMVLECKRGLCRGLVRFIAGLHQAKFLEKKDFHFTTSENVFQKRFEVFANIQQPPPLTYDDFLKGSDFARVSQSDLLLSTAECFKSSKELVGKITALLPSLDSALLSLTKEELNQIAKVCVGNSVYVQKMKQMVGAPDGGRPRRVEFDFDSNCEFCTIKLT